MTKIILMASGETLLKFKDNFGNEYKRASVNGTILNEEIRNKIDYFFWGGDIDIPQHPTPTANLILNTSDLLSPNIIKYTNTTINGQKIHPGVGYATQIDDELAKSHGFKTYNIITEQYEPSTIWHKDISKGLDCCSIIFAAMQILIDLGFKEIILVGCDCVGSHFYSKEIELDISMFENPSVQNLMIKRWKHFKNFLEKEHPSVKVKCINPIGLKNIFQEIKN